MRKTLIMLTSVIMAALFIGTSMTTAIARESLTGDVAKEVEIKDNAISEEAQAIEQEPECTECAAAAQIEDMDNGEESLQGTTEGEDPPCNPCEEAVIAAVDGAYNYLLDNMPEFNILDWRPGYISDYILDVVGVFIGALVIALGELMEGLNVITTELFATLIDAALGVDHFLSIPIAIFVAAVLYLIELCQGLMGGDGGNTQSAPVSAPVSAPASIPMNTMSAGETATRSTQYGSMGL